MSKTVITAAPSYGTGVGAMVVEGYQLLRIVYWLLTPLTVSFNS